MNQEERSKTSIVIAMTAKYYGKVIEKEIVTMMVDDLQDLPCDAVITCYNAYRRDPKNKWFPLPAQIRDLVAPQDTHDSLGREIAGRIQQAIGKFGWCHPVSAQAFIGHAGWKIVQRFGGWYYICENHGLTLDPGIFHAQVRDQAIDMAKREPRENLISLPLPKGFVEMIESNDQL